MGIQTMVDIDKRQVLAAYKKMPEEQQSLLRALPEDFGVHLVIRDLRKTQGLTLEDLGERMGTTQETALRLEKGQLPLNYKWLLLAARALEVEPMALFNAVDLRGEDERRLMHWYRALGPGDQARLLNIAEAFAGPSARGDENIYERSIPPKRHYLNDK